MEYFIFVAIIVQAVAFLVVFLMMYKKDDRDKELTETILRNSLNATKEQSQTFIVELGKIQKAQFTILEKQTKDFMDGMSQLASAIQPKKEPPLPIAPFPLDIEKEKNTIEEEAPKDFFLDELPRIPNITEVNVKFEDEEKILGDLIDQ